MDGYLILRTQVDEREPILGQRTDEGQAREVYEEWASQARSGESVYLYRASAATSGFVLLDSHDVPL